MPTTIEELCGLFRYRTPPIEDNLGSILRIIQNSVQNAAEYEIIAKRLKEEHLEMVLFFWLSVFIKFMIFPSNYRDYKIRYVIVLFRKLHWMNEKCMKKLQLCRLVVATLSQICLEMQQD